MEPEQSETKTETQNAETPAAAAAAPTGATSGASEQAPAALAEAPKEPTGATSGSPVQEAPKAPSLVEQIAALIHEDQSASKRPPTLLYKINGALDLAKRILDVIQAPPTKTA